MSSRSPQMSAQIKILVVDARPIMAHGVTEAINARWPLLEVVGTAPSYARALALTERLRPDLVLFGFFSDPMQGPTVLQTLLHRWNVGAVLLRSEGDDKQVAQAAQLGVVDALALASTSDQILQTIVDAANRSKPGDVEWSSMLAHLPIRSRSRTRELLGQRDRFASLTPRERQVVQAMVNNPSAKYLTIGSLLGVSEHTVHNHLTSIYEKLQVTNRIELLVYATHYRLVDGAAPPQDASPRPM